MALERVVLRRERRHVANTVEWGDPHREMALGFSALVAERRSLRSHQRGYATRSTALRCIASKPGVYEVGLNRAS